MNQKSKVQKTQRNQK